MQTLPTLEPVRLYGAAAEDQAGAAAAGDFNGDGALDVVLAAAFADRPDGGAADSGAAYVFLGPFEPGEERDAANGDQALTIYGAAAGDQMGRSVAAGDFNGDSMDDIVVGSPFSDGPAGDRPDAGRVDLVAGSGDLGAAGRAVDLAQEGSSRLTVFGASPSDLAGFSSGVAEFNGDSAADLLIGAFSAAGPGEARASAGEVYVLYGGGTSGRVDLADASADVTVYGAVAGDRLGEGVAAGDVNGDGLDDLVLPAPFAANPVGVKDAGRTYVLASPARGKIDLASFQPTATIYGIDDGDQLGHVTATGDGDGDGKDDLLLTAVSADGPDNAIDLAGEAALMLGRTLRATVDAARDSKGIVYGRDARDRLGRSAAMGDIDGDGRAELILGAPGGAGANNDFPEVGELYVLPAEISASETAPGPGYVFYGSDPGDALASEVFGRNPLVAADMDADGRDELLAVAPLADGAGNERRDCGEAVILFITIGNGGQ